MGRRNGMENKRREGKIRRRQMSRQKKREKEENEGRKRGKKGMGLRSEKKRENE